MPPAFPPFLAQGGPLLLLTLFFSLGVTGQIRDGEKQLTPREIARATLPSVVVVVTTDQASSSAIYGSGFFVRPDVIATNFHVIQNAAKGYAKIVGEEARYEITGVVGADRKNDLVLLKLRGSIGKPLVLGNVSRIAIGDQVFAVGNPEGLEGTFSQGIVSSIRHENGYGVLQITAPISHGSSGGPVVDATGEVIGVAMGPSNKGNRSTLRFLRRMSQGCY